MINRSQYFKDQANRIGYQVKPKFMYRQIFNPAMTEPKLLGLYYSIPLNYLGYKQ